MKRHELTVPGLLGTSYMKRLDMLLPEKTQWLGQQPGLSPTGWFSHTTPQGSIPPRGLLLPSGPWSEGPWIGSTLTKKEVMFSRNYYLLSKLQISQQQCMEWKEAWQFLTCRNLFILWSPVDLSSTLWLLTQIPPKSTNHLLLCAPIASVCSVIYSPCCLEANRFCLWCQVWLMHSDYLVAVSRRMLRPYANTTGNLPSFFRKGNSSGWWPGTMQLCLPTQTATLHCPPSPRWSPITIWAVWGQDCICSPLYLQCLAQCLALSRCSRNILLSE